MLKKSGWKGQDRTTLCSGECFSVCGEGWMIKKLAAVCKTIKIIYWAYWIMNDLSQTSQRFLCSLLFPQKKVFLFGWLHKCEKQAQNKVNFRVTCLRPLSSQTHPVFFFCPSERLRVSCIIWHVVIAKDDESSSRTRERASRMAGQARQSTEGSEINIRAGSGRNSQETRLVAEGPSQSQHHAA